MVVDAQSPGLGRITVNVRRDGRRFTVDVMPDGVGGVSHAGAALLAEAAARLGMTESQVSSGAAMMPAASEMP